MSVNILMNFGIGSTLGWVPIKITITSNICKALFLVVVLQVYSYLHKTNYNYYASLVSCQYLIHDTNIEFYCQYIFYSVY